MRLRRARTLVAAGGLAVLLGVGLTAPASATVITPITPIAPARTAPSGPVAQPAPAPAKGPLPKLSPKALQAKAVKAARGATSVHVKETIKGESETLTVDAVVSKAAGKVAMVSSGGWTVNVVRVKEDVFMSANWRFWYLVSEDDAATADLFANQWIKVGKNADGRQELYVSTTPAAWTEVVSAIRPAKRVAGKKVRGKATVGLFEPGDLGGVLYVAAKGVPYPLVVESSDKSVSVTYFDWNKKVKVSAPRTFIDLPA